MPGAVPVLYFAPPNPPPEVPTFPRPDRSHRSSLRQRELCIVFLLVAVVWAQALGFMHRVTHGFHAGVGATSASAVAGGHRHDAGPAAGSGLEALFGQHEAESDCRLYDGLSQPLFAVAPLPVLPLLQPCTPSLRPWNMDFVARRAALFEARGPPFAA